jgi:succinate dehydrogenase / fumarate reductase cytochrome b subunit
VDVEDAAFDAPMSTLVAALPACAAAGSLARGRTPPRSAGGGRPTMTSLSRSVSSSIGAKIVMAVSGVLLALFLVAHLLGNLEALSGREAMNHYAELLRTFPWLLWVVRVGLLVSVVVHIVAAIRVTRMDRAARPQGYARARRRATTFAARTMLASGIVVAVFVVFHLLHFTTRSIEPGYKTMRDAAGRHDVFGMVVDAFQRPAMVALYVGAMLLVGLHLGHGVASAIHTLGAHHPRYRPSLRHVGAIFAVLIVLGFLVVPLAVLGGRVRP